jgi:CBS domain-containing protein
VTRPTTDEIANLVGKTLRVSELLALWGYRTRNYESVPTVESDLAAAGLTTAPPLRRRALDADVVIVPLGHNTEPSGTPIDHGSGSAPHDVPIDADEETGEAAPGILPQIPMLLGHVAQAHAGLIAVEVDAKLTKATALMTERNLSQLPVLDGAATVRGVITWESIAHMHALGHKSTLANAATAHYTVAATTDRFLPLISVIRKEGFVLVRKTDGALCGIVTTSDLAERFEAVAGPYFTLGEIEFRLRRCLKVFDGDDIKLAEKSKKKPSPNPQPPKKKSVDDMMFGGYVRLLEHEGLWPKLGWRGVDQDHFVEILDKVREIRNQVMHFNPKPLREEQVDTLDRFVGMLRHYDPDLHFPQPETDG